MFRKEHINYLFNISILLKPIIIILLLTSVCNHYYAQQSNWINLYNGQTINGVVSKGKDLWVGTSAGLVYINLDNDSTKLFTRDNSNIELQNSKPLYVDKQNYMVFVRGGTGPVYTNNVLFWPDIMYDEISSYVEDNDGNMWLGLKYWGVVKIEIKDLKKVTTKFNKSNSPLPSDNVRKIQFDKNGNLWIVTYEYDFRDTLSAGLVKYDGINWTVYNKKNYPIATNQLTDFVIDKNGDIWIGTEKKAVYKFSNNAWTRYPIEGPNSSISLSVSAMAVDSSNNLWVGTNFSGIYRYDGKEWKIISATNSNLKSSHIHSLTVDYQGGVWVGTQIGLYKYVNGDFKEYNTSNSTLPTPRLLSAVKDTKGNIWAIAEDYGSPPPPNTTKNNYSIVRYNGKEFSNINVNDIGSGSYTIYSLVINKQSDDLFIVTDKGFFRYDGEKITRYTNDFPLGFSTRTMCSDNYGNIWIGSSDGTITKFDGNKLINFSPNDMPFKLTDVSKIYFDGRYIWAGEKRGGKRLLRIDPINSITKLICEEISCPINDISDIIFDNNGYLWVSSFSNNIVRYKDSKWEIIDRNNSGIISEIVASMALDEKGRIIFGCRESNGFPSITSGISILDDDKWISYSYKNSKLGLRYINSVLSDNNGNVWVFGVPGISILNTSENNINYDLEQINEDILFQNFPNPYNSSTTIKYYLTKSSNVNLKIYNILGEEVNTLVNEQKDKGYFYITWNGKDYNGLSVSSGIYFYQLMTDNFSLAKKMILLR